MLNLLWYYCYRQIVQDAIDMADQKLVSPVIAKKFSLEKVNEAVQFVLDKKSTGKVIIVMKDDDWCSYNKHKKTVLNKKFYILHLHRYK